MTRTRYEERKETQVGDGDRGLSRLPGPAGSTGRESNPLCGCTTSQGLSCCLDEKLKTQTHVHTHTCVCTDTHKSVELF